MTYNQNSKRVELKMAEHKHLTYEIAAKIALEIAAESYKNGSKQGYKDGVNHDNKYYVRTTVVDDLKGEGLIP